MAGDSAREVARRMREKSERLARAADAWERGADGEDATARVLTTLPPEFVVLHDLQWPGRQRANIDHVVVGPTGVFVVDTKNWSGTVTVRDGVLRQNGFSREPAVAGAAEAGLAVARVVAPLPVSLVVPVLCFVRDDDLHGRARDVTLCSLSTVVGTITDRPLVLGPTAQRDALRAIDQSQRRPVPSSTVLRRRAVDSATRRPKRRTGLRELVASLLGCVLLAVVGPHVIRAVTDAALDAPAEAGTASPGAREPRPAGATRWVGTYRCGEVARAGRLDAWTRRDGRVAAEFRFGRSASTAASDPGGSYRLLGDVRDGVLVLEPVAWIDRPAGVTMVGFRAGAPTRGLLSGRVAHPSCTTFRFRQR